jgi:hypothetical protein
MANDITTAISGIAINNKRAVCSTLPTGSSAKLLIRPNYPVNLTIENIQNKFQDRFDDPSYYYGCDINGVLGTDSGDILGV